MQWDLKFINWIWAKHLRIYQLRRNGSKSSVESGRDCPGVTFLLVTLHQNFRFQKEILKLDQGDWLTMSFYLIVNVDVQPFAFWNGKSLESNRSATFQISLKVTRPSLLNADSFGNALTKETQLVHAGNPCLMLFDVNNQSYAIHADRDLFHDGNIFPIRTSCCTHPVHVLTDSNRI